MNARGDSFWRYIGMTENRNVIRGSHISKGYELSISLKDLLNRIRDIEKKTKRSRSISRSKTKRSKIIKEDST